MENINEYGLNDIIEKIDVNEILSIYDNFKNNSDINNKENTNISIFVSKIINFIKLNKDNINKNSIDKNELLNIKIDIYDFLYNNYKSKNNDNNFTFININDNNYFLFSLIKDDLLFFVEKISFIDIFLFLFTNLANKNVYYAINNIVDDNFYNKYNINLLILLYVYSDFNIYKRKIIDNNKFYLKENMPVLINNDPKNKYKINLYF